MGAPTFSITTLSIMARGLMDLSSIKHIGAWYKHRISLCWVSHFLFVMPNVVILNVVMLSGGLPSTYVLVPLSFLLFYMFFCLFLCLSLPLSSLFYIVCFFWDFICLFCCFICLSVYICFLDFFLSVSSFFVFWLICPFSICFLSCLCLLYLVSVFSLSVFYLPLCLF